ncbi:MAG TPA: Asp-tRNA(Asn)/Glu-tRNA(Gln) amidotransferase subunit GatB [Solirubrobacteraceae bacterium]|jgi:aspartyl-tRNA(Asn)/glutamyl-tRNA(Gln) amidotransferase subunit B|nr:Asp-tRNA(Asn)/Glu-tRNA(Gln) amidotransferase subunit GatB [Solirubrobacteraceae bacterium]
MAELEVVIGLEIHVQLATQTKMFCSCALSFGDPPNVHTCPVCLALPGALPVVNERAIHLGLMIGMALGSELAPRSTFHRKNYFYPDSPKGYQISQYDEPLCRGGTLEGVRIHRVHLEEDAAKLIHLGSSGRIHGSQTSVVDFNRGGTPLVEIVTEPDLRSAAQAREWLELLRATLRALGVSDVNMEEGSLRADANVSLRAAGSSELGTKAELKNMNSFRYLERGIGAEVERQSAIISGGGEVEQETLHFDPASGHLTPLRSKEDAQDYRYFPEPDLVPIAITAAMLGAARAAMPELPAARAARFESELSISPERARQLAFRGDLGDFFERAVSASADGVAHARRIADWLTGEVLARLGDADPASSRLEPGALAALAALLADGVVTATAAREVLDALISDGGDPAAIVAERGLGAIADSDGLAEIVARAIAADPDTAEQVRSGNAKAIGALVGPIMRETRGRADGAELQRLIRAALGVGD